MLALLTSILLSSPLAEFAGEWRCDGRFVASGEPISSRLSIAREPSSGVFIVRHDDVAPHPYHSVELWTADRDGRNVSAVIADGQGDFRLFRAPSVDESTLILSRSEAGLPKEEFRYEVKASGDLQFDWSVARGGAALHLGDRLTCRRETGG